MTETRRGVLKRVQCFRAEGFDGGNEVNRSVCVGEGGEGKGEIGGGES